RHTRPHFAEAGICERNPVLFADALDLLLHVTQHQLGHEFLLDECASVRRRLRRRPEDLHAGWHLVAQDIDQWLTGQIYLDRLPGAWILGRGDLAEALFDLPLHHIRIKVTYGDHCHEIRAIPVLVVTAERLD